MAVTKRHKQRPVFFNLLQIQLPVGALTSIVHRVTGILLAFSIPAVIYLFDVSLQNQNAYAQVIALFDNFIVKGLALLVLWALAHHLLAGIRHLLMDIDAGSKLAAARRSAWLTNITGLAIALLAAKAML